MSIYAAVPLAPRDPILGITEAFREDQRADKVNLGVGVYLDEQGKLPVLECVRRVEQELGAQPQPHAYLPIDGLPTYLQAVKELVFGAGSPLLAQGRVATLQGLGGTGGLRIGAGLLAAINPAARVLISDPSWENHLALFTRAGFEVASYRYYNPVTKGLDVAGMLADLEQADEGSIVVLHACCHNPTGYELGPADWAQVVELTGRKGLIPFLDMAYQGFGRGIAEDAAAVTAYAQSGQSFLVATSFSKSLSLYGERVGAISFVTQSADEAARVLSQAKVVVRTLYSNAPTYGARIAAQVLTDPELRRLWEAELATMRQRIKQMRAGLRSGLEAATGGDYGYITDQAGMFSYSGLSQPQMESLRRDYAVYALDSGRLCVAALNTSNLDQVVTAIAAVSR